ncbi:putative transporter SVOPL [Sorex araneus]|uniref:putative transporter SVOPL n=1 Tax=Sorex araneus TaxID=42254 RepID=UPI00243371AA|nr:putative transporter SVOPL [Sorex araneus]
MVEQQAVESALPLHIQDKRGRFKDLLDPKYLRTTLQIWLIWLGISFAYYGVILASAELLERDLVCGSRTESESEPVVTVGDSEETQGPCYCHMFAPSDYRTMIISTLGEIALNPLNILGINFLGRRLSLSITMGCTALFFLLLNICTSSAGLIGFLFMLRALVAANFNTIYIYTAEVYPTTMRALGMGTSGSLCRIGAMVAPFISQVLMSASILGALCLFSSVCVVCAISAFTLPIETKGRALQQYELKLFVPAREPAGVVGGKPGGIDEDHTRGGTGFGTVKTGNVIMDNFSKTRCSNNNF